MDNLFVHRQHHTSQIFQDRAKTLHNLRILEPEFSHLHRYFAVQSQKQIHFSKYVDIIKTKEMRIETTNSLVHLDGEPITLSKTITIKNHPKSLKIFASNEKK